MKNENRENPPAICRRDRCERRVGRRNWRATLGRAIENKDGTGVLYRKETECGLQKGRCEIWYAHGSFAGSGARKQRGVGIAHRGCRERRDALRAERGQVFRARVKHEIVHHGPGAVETRARLPLPYDAGNVGCDFQRGRAWWRPPTFGARRPQSFHTKTPPPPKARI